MNNDIYTKPATETKDTYKGKVAVPSKTPESFEAIKKIPERVDTVSSASLEMLEGSSPSVASIQTTTSWLTKALYVTGVIAIIAAVLILIVAALYFGWL
ncbi:MAG: hypothetical protein IJV62_02805 [Eggerthellaceae bacterium]|nr:hypothetical protein [Eggerthellaceae bacterium]